MYAIPSKLTSHT